MAGHKHLSGSTDVSIVMIITSAGRLLKVSVNFTARLVHVQHRQEKCARAACLWRFLIGRRIKACGDIVRAK